MRVLTQVEHTADLIRAANLGVEVIEIPLDGELDPGITGEVLYTPGFGTHNLAEVLPRGVRWVHATAAGLDRFPFELLDGQVFTCSRGGGAIPIAEWALAMMLAFEKQLPQSWIREPPEVWHDVWLGGLHGRTLGIIGLGGIGLAVADRALPFGMNVIGLRRTDGPAPRPGIEMTTSLASLLARSDHVVLAAPLTAATHHLLDTDAFAAIKSGAHLVNIARGKLIDQDALRVALEDGRVAVASLDVSDPEPLPAGHWLYTHPQVRFSPHISWSSPAAVDIIVDMFLDNLRRYLASEPLEGIVDLEARY